MGLPYSITIDISNALKLPDEFYWYSLGVLTQCNGLLFVLKGLKEAGVLKLTMPFTYLVLNHLLYRTLQFNKIFEFVPYPDIIKGRPDIALPGCPVSPRTIKTIMVDLSPAKGDLLLKLYVTQNGHGLKTPLRGFNLPAFLQLVEACMYADINIRGADTDEDIKPSILMLKNLYLLEQLNDLLSHYEKTFNFLLKYKKPIVVEKLDKFVNQLKRHLPSGRDYQEAKEDVIEAKRHLAEKKLRKWYAKKSNIDEHINS